MEWSDLVANQLHDLKNRLGVLMQQIDSDPASHRTSLQQNSRLIHDDLTNLLTLFRLERDQLQINRLDLPLCDALEEALAQHEPLIESTGIKTEIHCDFSSMGFYDRPLVVSVLSHGVLNAIHQGADNIQLSAQEHADGCSFIVDDSGASDDTSPPLGTGIGLTLGREIATAHRRGSVTGKLDLTLQGPLGGARLELRLP